MYNKTNGVENEKREKNLYFEIIEECRKRVDNIRSKITIITSPQVESVEKIDTPIRTELESNLKALLSKIIDLENDIVI